MHKVVQGWNFRELDLTMACQPHSLITFMLGKNDTLISVILSQLWYFQFGFNLRRGKIGIGNFLPSPQKHIHKYLLITLYCFYTLKSTVKYYFLQESWISNEFNTQCWRYKKLRASNALNVPFSNFLCSRRVLRVKKS